MLDRRNSGPQFWIPQSHRRHLIRKAETVAANEHFEHMVEYGLGPQPILRWYLDARISVKRFEVALATCNETSIEEVRDARSRE